MSQNDYKLDLLKKFVRDVTGGSLNDNHFFSFEELQSTKAISAADKYRADIRKLYGSDNIRSSTSTEYHRDQKPALNLLKQLLKYHGYELKRISEYQGKINNKKLYESRYTIRKMK